MSLFDASELAQEAERITASAGSTCSNEPLHSLSGATRMFSKSSRNRLPAPLPGRWLGSKYTGPPHEEYR